MNTTKDLCEQGKHFYENVNKGTAKPIVWKCSRCGTPRDG